MQLQLHQIDARDGFGDGVLHLQARICFDEVEAIGRLIHHEFEGAKTAIVRRLRHLYCGRLDAPAQTIRQQRRRRDLYEFLMPSLQGAITITELHDDAAVIARHLHFDVPRVADHLLHIDRVVAKGRLCFRARTPVSLFEFTGSVDDAHAPPTATTHGLNDHRCAAQRRKKLGRLRQCDRVGEATNHRHAFGLGQCAGAGLIAKERKVSRRWPDEQHASVATCFRKSSVFTEKTVTRMDRVAAVGDRCSHDLLNIKIGASTNAIQHRTDISLQHMQRTRIILGTDRNRRDVQIRRCPSDANRNFAAICDQQFLHDECL